MAEPTTVEGVVNAFSDHLERNERKLDDIAARVNKADLNGSAPVLRNIAKVLGPKVDKLAQVADNVDGLVAVAKAAPEITQMVKEQEDRAIMWREFKRRIRWDKGTAFAVKALVTGAASAVTLFTVAQIWLNHSGTPSVPSSRPPVVTPIPTVTPSSSPKATP